MKGSKARKRLQARIAAFEQMRGNPGPRPGDKITWTKDGKKIMYHRPGSLKK